MTNGHSAHVQRHAQLRLRVECLKSANSSRYGRWPEVHLEVNHMEFRRTSRSIPGVLEPELLRLTAEFDRHGVRLSIDNRPTDSNLTVQLPGVTSRKTPTHTRN